MPPNNGEISGLPSCTDLNSGTFGAETETFSHLSIPDSEFIPREFTPKRLRLFLVSLFSSILFHCFIVLLAGIWLSWSWPDDSLQMETFPSFDVSLSGYEPSNDLQNENNKGVITSTVDSLTTPNTQENIQVQETAVEQTILEFKQERETQEVAVQKVSAQETESNNLSNKINIETSVTEPQQIQFTDIDAIGREETVTTVAESPLVTFKRAEGEIAETGATEEHGSQKINNLPTKALSSSEIESLETQITRWQQDLFEQAQRNQTVSWSHNGQHYSTKLVTKPAMSASDIDRAEIVISTVVDGQRYETQVEMKRLAFSHYGQFVNQWGRDMYLHQDVIEGRFHSNSTINIHATRNASPVFHGPVTTAYEIDVEGRKRDKNLFLGGLETRVDRINFPSKLNPQLESNFGYSRTRSTEKMDDGINRTSQQEILNIDGDATVIFYTDGSFTWQYKNSSKIERRNIDTSELYIVGAEGSILSVKGVVRGRVVVFSPEEISIIGDIRYSSDPDKFSGSTDYLGLISEKYVEIASPNITGPGDLTIYAAIYAKRRFSVRRFSNNNRGLLTVYGSLSAGSLSASEPRYATRIKFDKRFEQQRPPGYPMTERYELEHWDRQWRIVN